MTTEKEIGQLPSLTESQLLLLNARLNRIETPLVQRLCRDSLLSAIDSSSYCYNSTTVKLFAPDHRIYLDCIVNKIEDYQFKLHSTVDEIVRRVSTVPTEDLIVDSISIERVPNDYSRCTRSRVQDVLSLLFSLRDEQYDYETWQYEDILHLSRLSINRYSLYSSAVYMCKYMGKYPMILKYGHDAVDVLHEYLVGVVVNSLRSDIANYMYTYGVTRGIDLVDGGSVIRFCRQSDFKYTLLVEYLENIVRICDITKSTVVKTATATLRGSDMFRFIVLQLICAMSYSYYRLKFVHRDPNSTNIALVPLGRVMAVPIMVPSLADGTLQFTKKWILTDTLVMFLDYDLSTVSTEYLQSNRLKYSHLISPSSIYRLYETRTDFANDLVIMLECIFHDFRRVYSHTDQLDSIAADILHILHRLYTGQSAEGYTEQFSVELLCRVWNTINYEGRANYYVTHPDIKYDSYGAVIEFCSKYTEQYSHEEYDADLYSSVLDSHPDLHYSTVLTDTMQYQLHTKYPLEKYTVDMDAVQSNDWYRQTVLVPMIGTDYSYSNRGILQCIYDNIRDREDADLLIAALYRYMKRLVYIKPNMQPLTYSNYRQLRTDYKALFCP